MLFPHLIPPAISKNLLLSSFYSALIIIYCIIDQYKLNSAME